MKQLLLFALVVLAFASIAFSDQSASKAKEIEITGEVVSVNMVSNEILIRVIEKGKAKNILFAVADDSVLSDSDQNTLELEEIEQGSRVTVRYSKSRMKAKQRLSSLQVVPESD
jgi:lipopolysaccharide export system protein LptA